jgi:Mg2+ and Co2+ transporter CorA
MNPYYTLVGDNNPGTNISSLEEALITLGQRRSEEILWLDIGHPSPRDMLVLEKHFQLHKLLIEDLTHNESLEKFETFPGFNYLSLQTNFDQMEETQLVLHVLQFEETIVTIHRNIFTTHVRF